MDGDPVHREPKQEPAPPLQFGLRGLLAIVTVFAFACAAVASFGTVAQITLLLLFLTGGVVGLVLGHEKILKWIGILGVLILIACVLRLLVAYA